MRKYLKVFCHKHTEKSRESFCSASSISLHPYLRLQRVMSFYLIRSHTHIHAQTRGFPLHSCTDRCAERKSHQHSTHKTMNRGADANARWCCRGMVISSVANYHEGWRCTFFQATAKRIQGKSAENARCRPTLIFKRNALEWCGVEVAIATCVKNGFVYILLFARGAFVCFARESRLSACRCN